MHRRTPSDDDASSGADEADAGSRPVLATTDDIRIKGVSSCEDGFVVHVNRDGNETTMRVPSKRARVNEDACSQDLPDAGFVMDVLHGFISRTMAREQRAVAEAQRNAAFFSSDAPAPLALSESAKPDYTKEVVRDRGAEGNRNTLSYLFPVDSVCARFNTKGSMLSIGNWATMREWYVAGEDNTPLADIPIGLAINAKNLLPAAGAPAHSTQFPHGTINQPGGVCKHVVIAGKPIQIVARIKLPLGFRSHTDLMDFFNKELAEKYTNFIPITSWQWACYLVAAAPDGVTNALMSPNDCPEYQRQAQSTTQYKETNHSLFFAEGGGMCAHEMTYGVVERCFATPDKDGVLRFPPFQFRSEFLTSNLRSDAKGKNGVRFFLTPMNALTKHAALSAWSEPFTVQSAYVHSTGQNSKASRNGVFARPVPSEDAA